MPILATGMGVQDASRKYFGVDATNVTLSEAATLAGMLKGPGIYNPIDHPKMRMIGKHSTKCNGRKRKITKNKNKQKARQISARILMTHTIIQILVIVILIILMQ